VALNKKKPKTLMDQISISAGCFFAGVLCIVGGAQYQGELLGTGSAKIGRNSAYVTLEGRDAQININFFWVGAIVFILAALVNLIVAARREFKSPQPFDVAFNVVMICPTCEKPFALETLEKPECPDCQVSLVQLKGFYDKSPEKPTE
jgi:hypothetical protein